MPKLSKKLTKSVAKAEALQGFSLIEPGKYFAKLKDVEVRETNAGGTMWVAVWHDIRHVKTGKKVPGQQWQNLNLPMDTMPEGYTKGEEKFKQAQDISAGRLKAFFEALGYEVDSDTDEMIGEVAVIQIAVRTISSGSRQGEKANEVNGVESAEEFGDIPESDDDEGDADSDY